MTQQLIEPQAAPAVPGPSVRRLVARHPVAAFLCICYAVTWATAVPWFRERTDILPFDLPMWGSLGTFVGGVGVRDLARRSLCWRVGGRWYLLAVLGLPVVVLAGAIALFGTAALEALADDWRLLFTRVLPVLLLQLALFQLAEEVGWMGFLQARFQDRHGPLKASLLVTVPFALWHLPDLFAQVGLATALIFLPILAVAHLCARVVFMWLYNATGASVLLVAVLHASFDATVNDVGLGQLIPGPNGTAPMLATVAFLLAAVGLVVATRGRLAYDKKGP
jgi:uncharacterized protein